MVGELNFLKKFPEIVNTVKTAFNIWFYYKLLWGQPREIQAMPNTDLQIKNENNGSLKQSINESSYSVTFYYT